VLVSPSNTWVSGRPGVLKKTKKCHFLFEWPFRMLRARALSMLGPKLVVQIYVLHIVKKLYERYHIRIGFIEVKKLLHKSNTN
jgi:hypothetical protein